jgi:subtilisin family serine protease
MLFIAVAIWALPSPKTESALAKVADDSPNNIQITSTSACSDNEVDILPELVESQPSIDPIVTPASTVSETETTVSNEINERNQPILDNANVANLRQMTTGSHDTIVAVLDTGIDENHEQLSGKVIAEVNLTNSPTASDNHGHGTHVAGIIGANDDSLGISGIAPGCSLINVKVADDLGICHASDLAQGITWAVDNGANVINISIEIGEPSAQLENAIEYAWNHGSVLIAAAGNGGSDKPAYPAYYEYCLAVSAIKPDNELAPLSNYGDWVSVLAPGFEIYSTLPDNEYGCKTGTSFACAHVSGIAALLFDIATDTNHNSCINDEIRSIIESGCQDMDITAAS